MKRSFYLFILLALPQMILAQSPEIGCGFEPDKAMIQWMNSHHDAIARFKADPASRNRLREVKRVPLRFVAFNSGKTAGLSQADVNLAVSTLNKAFLPAGIEFFSCQAPLNVLSSPYASYLISEERALWQEFKATKVINIFCVESIEYGSVAGYTYLPGTNAPEAIFMLRTHLNLSTFAHEMGHYYGLYHTHGKSNCETLTDELVNGVNCEKTGDDVCDTPADPNLQGVDCNTSLVSFSCTYIGTVRDKNGDLFKPDPKNIMSYAPSRCKDFLSPGQYERIRYFSQFRVYPEECPPAVCNVPTIVSVDSTYNSVKLSWTAFAQDSLYQLRYRAVGDTAWKNSNLMSNQWTLSNLKSCTKLEVQVRRACGGGFSNWTNTLTLKTQGCDGTYCASYGGKSNIWINRLSVDTWDNTSGNNNGYLLYPSPAFSFTTGQTYSLQLEPGGSIRIRDSLHWQIWIDKTLDRDFDDPNELVYQGKSVQRIVHKANFELPADIKSGSSRMRIILSLNKFVASPCDTSAMVLETEDYPITLRASQVCAAPTEANLILKEVTNSSVTVKTKGLDVLAYQWEIRATDGSLSSGTPALPRDSLYFIGLTDNTDYQIRLRVLCKNGNYSAWSNPLVFATLGVPCAEPDSKLLTANKITHNAAQLSCGIHGSAAFYRFSYRIKGAQAWTEGALYPSNTAELGGLTPNTTYEYRVRVYCSGTLRSFSPSSQTKTFTTLQEPCRIPSADAIEVQMIGDTLVEFSYGLASLHYSSTLWRYRTRGATAWKTLPAGVSSYKVSEFGVVSEVAVQGICATGVPSEWSASKLYNTPCNAPKLSDLAIRHLRYSHAKIAYTGPKRTGFYWQYKRFNESNWSQATYEGDTLISINGLEPSTTYQFRLQGRCSTNAWSAYSDALNFTTIAFPCDTPDVSTFKVAFVSDNAALLTCDPVPGATTYIFNYRKKGTKTWFILPTSRSDQGWIHNLDNNTIYEFTVQIGCPFGTGLELSPLQAPNEFKTLPRICPLVHPDRVNVTYHGERLMQVHCDLYATAYAWRYRILGGRTWIDSTQSDSAKWLLKDLVFPATYEIQTKIQCPTGEWSDWSAKAFSTPNLECQQPSASLIQWHLVQDTIFRFTTLSHSYQEIFWRYRKVGSSEWTLLPDSLASKGLSFGSGESVEISIQGSCSGLGVSAWSNSTVLNGVCRKVPLSSIKIKSVGAQYAEIECSAENIAGFNWRYRVQGDSFWTWVNTVNGTLILADLSSESNYEFQVQRICSADDESWYTESLRFVTPELPCDPIDAGYLFAYKITAHSAVVSCQPKGEAKHYVLAHRILGQNTWTSGEAQEYPEWKLDSLQPNTIYEYRVGIRCDLARDLSWSTVREFTSLPPNFCPTPDPELLYIYYETRTRLNFSYPISEGEQLSWRYRKMGDSSWVRTSVAPNFTLEIDPKLGYEISLQKTCADSLISVWSAPSPFTALCRLGIEDIEIRDKAVGSILASSKMMGQNYLWALRRQGQRQWEKQIWTSTDQVTFDSLRPGIAYTIGLRVVCYQGDTSNWTFQTYYPQCGTITAKDIQVQSHELFGATFECFNYGYRQYQWRYRAKEEGAEWAYAYDNPAVVTNLYYHHFYELQVRGLCSRGETWSEWSESTVFAPTRCALPDTLKLVPNFIDANSVGILAENNEEAWLTEDFKWYYRVFGQKNWIDSVYNQENYLILHNLLPGIRYEIVVEVTCKQSFPSKMTYSGEFTMPADCFVPTTQSIQIQKLTQQSVEIALDLAYTVDYEVQYRIKGSNKPYSAARGRTWEPVLLKNLSSETEYEIRLRIICDQGAPWTEAFYIRTKACDIPYEGRIVLSKISADSASAYVELYDFNPAVTGVSHTWRYKLTQQNNWQQVFTNASNTLTIKSLLAGQAYDLQAILRCKKNTRDSIVFTTNFKATTNECSTFPSLTWVDKIFEGINNGFRLKCNLPFGYSISVRYWESTRQNVVLGRVVYLNPSACSASDLGFNFDVRNMIKLQFRLICPNGNIGPWSEVITLDKLQGAQEPSVEVQRPYTPAFKLWPNPNSGQFQVQLPDGVEGESVLSIFGADGRKVMTKKVLVYDQMPLDLDLSAQAAGLYFIRVQAGKNLFNERIIITSNP